MPTLDELFRGLKLHSYRGEEAWFYDTSGGRKKIRLYSSKDPADRETRTEENSLARIGFKRVFI